MITDEEIKAMTYCDFLASRGYSIFLSGIAKPKHQPTEDQRQALDYIRNIYPTIFRTWWDKK